MATSINQAGQPVDIGLQPVVVDTASADAQGQLVFAAGRLVAVLVQLASAAHGAERGRWFVEAGFGPCDPPPRQLFATPAAAVAWIRQRLAERAARFQPAPALATRD